jgi:methionyl-tRNA formyltransferase
MTTRLLLVGQRDSVLDVVLDHPAVQLDCCIAIAGSHLERSARQRGVRVQSFDKRDKSAALAAIVGEPFDLLLSVGCPWLLPIAELRLKRPTARFANVHPSCLPRLRGNHPINGGILFDEPYVGATVHWMDEDFDTGPIVAQRCIERTSDLDLGLLYAVVRMLEAEAMQAALDILAASGFAFEGTPQRGEASYYTRRRSDRECDAATVTSSELIRRVRAFGVPTQGCIVRFASGDSVVALDAEPIVNEYLHKRFAAAPAGSVLLRYDEHVLVRTCDGIVKLRLACQCCSLNVAPQ